MSTTVLKNNNVNIQIPRHLYSSLVATENFTSDMCIGPSTINKIIVSADNSGQISKAATITYSSILTPGLLYSNKVEISGDINLTFSNVKVKSNVEVVASSIRYAGINHEMPTMVFMFKDEATALQALTKSTLSEIDALGGKKIDILKDGIGTGLASKTTGLSPNPFQAPELCLASSFWNCMYSSSLTLATNGNAVSIGDTTKRYQDLICRTLPEDETRLVYDCALLPDKNIIRGEKLLAMHKTMAPLGDCHLNAGNTAIEYGKVFAVIDRSPNGAPETDTSKHVACGIAYTYPERLPMYNDINNDVNNANSKMYRGQYERNCEYTFKKLRVSPNFKIEKSESSGIVNPWFKITKLADTTELDTIYINGFCFPTHWKFGDGISPHDAYLALGDLLFFKYDNISPMCIKSIDTAGATKDYCYIYRNEPVDQALIVTKTIKNFTHTLFNPLLTMSDTNQCCYSNTSLFKCTLSRTSASIVDCLSYIGGVRLSDRDHGDNIVNVDYSVSNLNLIFDQYSMSAMESSVKPKSTLFYNNWSNVREQSVSVNVKADDIKRGYVTKRINLTNIPIGSDMPKSICFLIDGGSHSAPLYGCRITTLSSKLSSGVSSDSTRDRNTHQLYIDTKNSLLSNYTLQDLNSNYQVPFEYHTRNIHGVGSLICISLDNMGLSSQLLVSGVSSKTFTIGYDLDISIPVYDRSAGDNFIVRALCYHISECHMTLENSQSSMYNQLYTTEDVINSINLIKQASDNNKLTQSSRRYTAGSFATIFKGLYTLPKLLKTASNVANTVSSVANTTSNVLNKADGVVTRATNIFKPR